MQCVFLDWVALIESNDGQIGFPAKIANARDSIVIGVWKLS